LTLHLQTDEAAYGWRLRAFGLTLAPAAGEIIYTYDTQGGAPITGLLKDSQFSTGYPISEPATTQVVGRIFVDRVRQDDEICRASTRI